MKKQTKAIPSRLEHGSTLNSAIFWTCISLLVLVPLIFSPSVHRAYVIPKLAILLVGASILAPLTGLAALAAARKGYDLMRLFNPAHLLIVSLYFASVAVSTAFGLDPTASLFGFFHNQMGLVPRICFFAFFMGLIFGIENDESKLHKVVWAMALTGFVASAYGVIQFFGYDPFVDAALYTYRSQEGPVLRVIGTFGHANYLGNFLMYTTPISIALGIAGRGRVRLMALGAAGVSLIALVMSGTRGAWVGILAAGVAFFFLEVGSWNRIRQRMTRRVMIRRAALALVVIGVSAVAISLSPAGRSVIVRARSIVTERFTGSGRTLLWRDSIKMVPAFAFAGAGPDSFRMAFLSYKSEELARLTGFNNESSHNSYLDAAISYGLPGALLYIAVIASAFRLLVRARRQTASPRLKVVITGLFASLVAAAVHNFFIFDQIPTGLYFFAFIGLAQVASNLTEVSHESHAASARTRSNAVKATRDPSSRWSFKAAGWTVAAIGGVLVGAAVWYAAGTWRADLEINNAIGSAQRGDLDRVIAQGGRAASSPEPTGDHDLMVARALALCSSRLESSLNAARQSGVDDKRIAQALDRATNLATTYAERSVQHTFTPDLSYLFLAANAQATGNVVKMRENATEALRWDPHNLRARILLAEAHIAEGNREQAEFEAERALKLDPFSSDAASALARSRGETNDPEIRAKLHNRRPSLKRPVKDLIEVARDWAQKGQLRRARFRLLLAIDRAEGPCPDCHRELAIVEEKMGRFSEAIAEWKTFIEQAPERASVEQIKARIETLEQKNNSKRQ